MGVERLRIHNPMGGKWIVVAAVFQHADIPVGSPEAAIKDALGRLGNGFASAEHGLVDLLGEIGDAG